MVNFLNAQFNKPTAEEEDEAALKQIAQKSNTQAKNTTKSNNKKSGEIIIEGVGNLMHTIANCCRPIPGDPIIGFITQGRGISIHRADCEQLQELKNHAPERIIEAVWSGDRQTSYTMVTRVVANDRSGLLRDITTILANEKVNVLSLSSRSDMKQQLATIDMDMEIFDQDSLNRVLNKIKQLPDVIEAKRLG